jgi:HSP20 family protein
MAARQDTSKPQEANRPQEQQAKQPEGQTKQPTENRSSETGVAPRRHGTTPARQGAWGPLTRLRDEFDRLFDQFSRGWLGAPAGRWEGGWGLDVREDDNAVTVRAEAPGFEPSDFDIQVRGDQLVMRATHKAEEEEEGGYRQWRRQEFYEAVTLPAEVDADKVKAGYRNGILTVTLPKSEGGKARRITVEG